MQSEAERPVDFIREKVIADNATDRFGGEVVTRFPPEPNGYLHVGHAKAICINFGIAADHGGRTHLRFDDTNPQKEDDEFVQGIIEDLRWLGFDWGEHLYHASDYFEPLYQHARTLIEVGKAYVCELNAKQIREYRGTLTEPGRDSPHRERPPAESLELFGRMRAGDFDPGSRTLRAKIDMASPNINLRDPVLYRIQDTTHHRTGTEWSVYPMYDYAHCVSDSIEGITHSLCSLEFENHRPLYDWILDQLEIHHPQQIEFARLNLTHTVMSKRKLRRLVEEGHVAGWDDPRLPTLRGMRRRGYTPESIRTLCDRVGIAKRDSTSELALLEHCVREDLNRRAPRAMGVLDPVRLVIENYPEGEVEEFDAINNPEDISAGTRKVPFSRELWIERDDFREEAGRKYFRLKPGQEVRLRYAYLVTCTGFLKDDDGNLIEVRCSYDPETRGGDAPDGRRVKGTIHWVSAEHAVDAEVRLYETLFASEFPEEVELIEDLNPNSLMVCSAKVEPSLAQWEVGSQLQFERTGYFCVDPDSGPGALVFNRTVPLRDSWAKIAKKGG